MTRSLLMETWHLEKSGSSERKKKIPYTITHDQSDLCPKGTLKIRFQIYQTSLHTATRE